MSVSLWIFWFVISYDCASFHSDAVRRGVSKEDGDLLWPFADHPARAREPPGLHQRALTLALLPYHGTDCRPAAVASQELKVQSLQEVTRKSTIWERLATKWTRDVRCEGLGKHQNSLDAGSGSSSNITRMEFSRGSEVITKRLLRHQSLNERNIRRINESFLKVLLKNGSYETFLNGYVTSVFPIWSLQ